MRPRFGGYGGSICSHRPAGREGIEPARPPRWPPSGSFPAQEGRGRSVESCCTPPAVFGRGVVVLPSPRVARRLPSPRHSLAPVPRACLGGCAVSRGRTTGCELRLADHLPRAEERLQRPPGQNGRDHPCALVAIDPCGHENFLNRRNSLFGYSAHCLPLFLPLRSVRFHRATAHFLINF